MIGYAVAATEAFHCIVIESGRIDLTFTSLGGGETEKIKYLFSYYSFTELKLPCN